MTNDVEEVFEIIEGDLSDLSPAIEGMGIRFRCIFLPAPIDVLINEYMSTNCIEPMKHKAIISPKQREEDRLKKLKDYLRSIEVSGSPLVIIDPYFFCVSSSEEQEYSSTILDLIRSSEASEVRIITKPGYSLAISKRIIEMLRGLGIQCTLTENNDFHDRFWLSPDKRCGFSMGTSLNGFGKRISCIQHLKSNDVRDILGIIDELEQPQYKVKGIII